MPRKKPEPSKTSEQDTWKEEASQLSYEEALQALDVLLGQLQDDSIPLADLQKNHAHMRRSTSIAVTYFSAR